MHLVMCICFGMESVSGEAELIGSQFLVRLGSSISISLCGFSSSSVFECMVERGGVSV